jgi:hypothetical protein
VQVAGVDKSKLIKYSGVYKILGGDKWKRYF